MAVQVVGRKRRTGQGVLKGKDQCDFTDRQRRFNGWAHGWTGDRCDRYIIPASMKTISRVQLVLFCAATIGLFAVEPSATLLENGDVKVSRALEKAHVKGSFHEHKTNRVMVYLQSGRQRFEYQDGRQPQVFDWKAGQVVWSPSEGMHSPEVVSDDPFNIIEMELKKPGAGKAVSGPHDALKIDGKQYKLEFENDQVRVVRLKLGPHEATPVIERSRNSVAIFLTDAALRTTDSKGVVASVTHKAGEAVWETPVTQKVENVSDVPLEMVLVELNL